MNFLIAEKMQPLLVQILPKIDFRIMQMRPICYRELGKGPANFRHKVSILQMAHKKVKISINTFMAESGPILALDWTEKETDLKQNRIKI